MTCLSERAHRSLLVFVLQCVLASGADSASGASRMLLHYAVFRQSSSYDHGSLHVAVQNGGPDDLVLTSISLNGNGLTFPDSEAALDQVLADGSLPILSLFGRQSTAWHAYPPSGQATSGALWMRCHERRLGRGEVTEIVVKLAHQVSQTQTLAIANSLGETVTVSLQPTPPGLAITGISFSSDLSECLAVVSNRDSVAVSVNHVSIDGHDVTADCRFLGAAQIPGRNRCGFSFRMPFEAKPGDCVCLRISSADGAATGGSVRVFPWAFPIQAAGEADLVPSHHASGMPDFSVLQNQPAAEQAARLGLASRAKERNSRVRPVGLMLGQGYICLGSATLAELVDAVMAHPEPRQALYLGRYDNSNQDYVEAVASFLNSSCSPTPVHMICNLVHGRYGATDPSQTTPLSPAEARLRTYMCVARGAKGILFRAWAWDDGKEESGLLRREVEGLTRELSALGPFLAAADTLDDAAWTSEPLVEAAALLSARGSMVVVLMNHDHNPTNWPSDTPSLRHEHHIPFVATPQHDPLDVNIRIPEGTAVSECTESLTGAQCSWSSDGAGLVTVHLPNGMGDCTALALLLRLRNQGRGGSPALDSGSRHGSKRQGPDVRFTTRQVLHREVDPTTTSVLVSRFPFRNVGNGELHLYPSDKEESQVQLVLPAGAVAPQEEAVVEVRIPLHGMQLQEEKLFAQVGVRTDDPDEPLVDLYVGARVKDAAVVWPRELQFGPVGPADSVTRRLYVSDTYSRFRAVEVEGLPPGVTYAVTETTTAVPCFWPSVFAAGTDLLRTFQIGVTVTHGGGYPRASETVCWAKVVPPSVPPVGIRLRARRAGQVTVTPEHLFLGEAAPRAVQTRRIEVRSDTPIRFVDLHAQGNCQFGVGAARSVDAGLGLEIEVRVDVGDVEGVETGTLVVGLMSGTRKLAAEVPYTVMVTAGSDR